MTTRQASSMKALLLCACLGFAGCATPDSHVLMRPGDTLLIRSTAPLFEDRAGSLSPRRGLVVAERNADRTADRMESRVYPLDVGLGSR